MCSNCNLYDPDNENDWKIASFCLIILSLIVVAVGAALYAV